MDTALLKTFLVLAKTSSFTQAASKLHRTQAAISLQVGRLEQMLGKALFIRDNRNVVLTHEGEELIGLAQEVLKAEEKMLFHFSEAHHLAGEVRFGTPEDLATIYLPSILSNFVETHPHILLNVDCDLTKHLQQGFENNKYDLVLIKQDPKQPYPQSVAIFDETLVWVAHPSIKAHLEEKKTQLPLILAPSPCVYRQKAIDALNASGINWRVVFSSPSFTGIVSAVKAGLGVSVMPKKMVPDGLVIIEDLPEISFAQIALLKKEGASNAVDALASYVSSHIILDENSFALTTC
jgi:DNA-binding transcriptional LysR family regulator